MYYGNSQETVGDLNAVHEGEHEIMETACGGDEFENEPIQNRDESFAEELVSQHSCVTHMYTQKIRSALLDLNVVS